MSGAKPNQAGAPGAAQPAQVKETYKPDQKLINGPISDEERSCTDIICCLLWIAAMLAMIAVAAVAFSKGHPDRLLVGYDSDGSACGIDPAVANYPFIYLVLPYPGYLNRTVCVKECPQWATDATALTKLNCVPNHEVTSCNQQFAGASSGSASVESFFASIDTYDESDLMESTLVYNSTGLWERVCVPNEAIILDSTDFSSLMGDSDLGKYFSDVKNSWKVMLGMIFMAFGIGLVYMVIMRYFSGIFLWLAIVAYFAALVLLAVYLRSKSTDYFNQAQDTSDAELKADQNQSGNNLKYLSFLAWAVFAVSIVGLICLYKQIRLAVAIVKTAAAFVGDVWSVMLVPPIIALFIIGWFALWLVVFVFGYAVGEIQGSSATPFASVKHDENTSNMLWYWLFGGLWTNAFIMAVNQFLIASTAAIWYFSEKDKVHRPVSRSLFRAFRYHLGSLAFGSLLLALVQFARIVLAYIKQNLKATGQENNRFVKCLLNCMQCFLACFERCIEFLNKNAYIQIAVTGDNFCTAAKNAFSMIVGNAGRFAMTATVGQIYTFIGKLFISLATAYICYMILSQASPYKDLLFSPLLPTVFVLFLAYIIGDMFMSVYGMGIDTILVCAIVDEDIMKVTGQQPKYMPQSLRDFFADNYKPPADSTKYEEKK